MFIIYFKNKSLRVAINIRKGKHRKDDHYPYEVNESIIK